HTNQCPTGVATQDTWRQRALVVPDKAERVYNFHHRTVHAVAEMLATAGLSRPEELRPHHLVRRISSSEVKLFSELHYYCRPGELLSESAGSHFYRKMWRLAQAHTFAPAEL
ncbi:MAG TPA: glutamate synthase-related protein, partial [Moraxellaceae bacterium]